MKKKIIIKSSRFEASDQEISEFMDFDKLLKVHRQPPSSFPWKITLGVTAGVIMLVSVIGYVETKTKTKTKTKSELGVVIPEAETVTENNAGPGADLVEDKDMKNDQRSIQHGMQEPTDDAGEKRQDLDAESRRPETTELHSPSDKNENTAPAGIEDNAGSGEEIKFVKAEPVGGLEALYVFLDDELTYPATATGSGITGKSLVTFSVFKDGSVGGLTIDSSLGEAFDQEIQRVFDKMPIWVPATVNGDPVESKISIPLFFNE